MAPVIINLGPYLYRFEILSLNYGKPFAAGKYFAIVFFTFCAYPNSKSQKKRSTQKYRMIYYPIGYSAGWCVFCMRKFRKLIWDGRTKQNQTKKKSTLSFSRSWFDAAYRIQRKMFILMTPPFSIRTVAKPTRVRHFVIRSLIFFISLFSLNFLSVAQFLYNIFFFSLICSVLSFVFAYAFDTAPLCNMFLVFTFGCQSKRMRTFVFIRRTLCYSLIHIAERQRHSHSKHTK